MPAHLGPEDRRPAPTAAVLAVGASGVDDLDEAFPRLSGLMRDLSGVTLPDRKAGLVRARLARRLRVLRLSGFQSYADMVESAEGADERALMVDLLTTNKTSFFRESAHFDYLRDALASSLDPARVRVWSAGCSTGEEAYTLSVVLRAALPAGADLRILATDISSRVLRAAEAAEYPDGQVADVPERYRSALLERAPRPVGGGQASDEPRWRVRREVREHVTIARLNLLERWPMRGPFDAIFCRNVMIYFDGPTRATLVRRFASLLAPGGHLFVGHSESLHALDHGLRYVRPAVYGR
jgi:chemotaxis protein methyltransferase CheR